jgi:hypothetical protein
MLFGETVAVYFENHTEHTDTLRGQNVPGGKVNILGGHSIGHSKKETLFEHVSYSEQFLIFDEQYFKFGAQYFASLSLSLSMNNHNSQLTLHTDSHGSGSGALRREERKILRAKYRKPFEIGHMFI